MTKQPLTVVITGGSSGIGAESARLLAARGATVCLLARRADDLAIVVDEITAAGGRAVAYPVDLTDPEATDAVVAALLADHPRIDVLVNNAGRSIRRSIADSVARPHDFERTIAINYLAAVRLTLGLLPRFYEQGSGHVVMSSTMSTQIPMPLFAAYIASKAALDSFARSLAAENAHRGITTTTVHFPLVRTDMSRATSIYAAMPMMSASTAARWIVRAVIDRPTRVTSMTGAASELGMAVIPGILTRVVTPQIRRMDKHLARKVRRRA